MQDEIGTLWVAGCSFVVGDGLHEPNNERATAKVAKKLGVNEMNYGVRGSSNFGVFLQAKYCIDQAKENDIVIISTTSAMRTEWFDDGIGNEEDINIKNINYDHFTNPVGNHFKDDPEYNPKLKMCQYWNDPDGSMMDEYFMGGVSRSKLKTISRFFVMYYPERAKVEYDSALFSLLHLRAKKKNVRHIIYISKILDDVNYIDEENRLIGNWFDLSEKFPDDLGTGHCCVKGHDYVRDEIIKKIKDNKWL